MREKQILKYLWRVIYGSVWLFWIVLFSIVSQAQALYASWGFLQFLVPVGLIFLGIWFFYRLIRFHWLILLPLSGLIWAYPLLNATFAWNRSGTCEQQSLEVLSYNVRVFNSYPHLEAEKPGSSQQMIQWLAEHPADIKCVQEFFHSCHQEGFNTIRSIGELPNYHCAYHVGHYPYVLHNTSGYFGKVIFSRFPIIHSETFYLDNQEGHRQNGLLADVVVGKDTLRIMNVHLQSLHIDEKQLLKAEKSWNRAFRKYRELIQLLQRGYQKRAIQAQNLEKYIQKSPYPIILCGDFNDLPYSYTYQRVKKHLRNSFEYGGRGFGFSYHGKLPGLRIDHQFHSLNIKIKDFQTLSNVPHSDHFPTLGKYCLP